MTLRLLRLGLAGWKRRWLGSVLTFLLIAMASGALMLSLQLRDVAARPWQRTFEATNGAHVLAFGPTRSVEQLAEVDGVTEAAGPLPMVVTSMDVRASTYGFRAMGADDLPRVERPAVTDGRWLRADGEVVLERSFADAIGVEVGEAVELKGVDGPASFAVVGLVVSAREAPYPDNQPGEGYVRRADIAGMQPDDTRWSWIEAVRVGDPSQVSVIAQRASDQLPRDARVLTSDDRQADASERHRTTSVVLRTFSVTLLIAVALVLATLVGARVLDRSAELGLLKAVGFTPAQVTAVVIVEQMLVAVVASIAGALGGSWLTPRIIRRSTELLGTVPVTVSAARVAATAAGVIAIVVVAATVPTMRLARAGVLRSLAAERDDGATNGLARRIPLRRPLPVTLAVKQVLARPARSTVTAFALAITVGSLVAGLAFEATVANEDAAEQRALATRPIGPLAGELAPDRPDPVAIVDSTREQLRPIVHSFNAVLVSVAVVNLLATALLSLRRRRREVALGRAIGLTPRQVRRTVFCSDGLLGLIAAIAGIPLGTAMFLGVYQLVNGNTDLAALPPAWQLAAVPVACVAAVIGVVAIPARQAANQSVTAGLQYE